MRVVESDAEKFFVVAKKLDDIAGFRVSFDRLDFVAEDPLVAGEDPVFFVLADDDLFFHENKVERIGTRVNAEEELTGVAHAVQTAFPCCFTSIAEQAKVWYIECSEASSPATAGE